MRQVKMLGNKTVLVFVYYNFSEINRKKAFPACFFYIKGQGSNNK